MISSAFENSSFSIFHGRWSEYIHETLTSPLSYSSMVLASVLAAALRGLVVGVIIVGIGLLFTELPVREPFYLLAFMTAIPLLFASFGVIGGLVADDVDHLTVMNQFVLRPLVFFGAVFYSLEILPPAVADAVASESDGLHDPSATHIHLAGLSCGCNGCRQNWNSNLRYRLW